MKGLPSNSLPRQLGLIVLASAMGFPAAAQSAPAGNPASSAPVAASESPSPAASQAGAAREGFWGRVNPFARKKWVQKRIDPLNDRLSELDQVNARNGRAIEDVDQRAQAGIKRAQGSADAAQQAADAAAAQAKTAGLTAQGAHSRVDGINTTVAGLDNFQQVSDVTIDFRAGQTVLNAAAKAKLDALATSLTGRQGYLLEIEGHAPQAGSVGIETSGKLTEAVRRYLVTDHEIPVYRLRAVSLGNAQEGSEERVRTSSVRVRLMENSLAARETASPHDAAPASGAERP